MIVQQARVHEEPDFSERDKKIDLIRQDLKSGKLTKLVFADARKIYGLTNQLDIRLAQRLLKKEGLLFKKGNRYFSTLTEQKAA